MKLRLIPAIIAVAVVGSSCDEASGPGDPDNNAPRLSPIANQTVSVGESKDVEISTTDVDGDALTISAVVAPDFLSLEGFTQVGNTATATCLMEPTAADVGTHTVTVRVTDGKGGEDSHDFSVQVEPLAPEPGDWSGAAEFGYLEFTVNDQSTAITEVRFIFFSWRCGGVTRDGQITSGSPSGWPISDGEFTIESDFSQAGLSMTVHGSFQSSYGASGTWTADSYGTTCSGVWQAGRGGYDPQLTVFMSATCNETVGIVGFGWLRGSRVTLEIDNGADGTIDFRRTSTIPANGEARFKTPLEPMPFAVVPGDSVSIYDSVTRMDYAVEYITLTSVDITTDVVTGRAHEGSVVLVSVFDPSQPFPGSLNTTVVADANMTWTADFSGIIDIVANSSGQVATRNAVVRATTAINWELGG